MSEGWSLKFELAGLPSLQPDTKHWRFRQKERVNWRMLVASKVGRMGPAVPLERARLRLTRHSTTRPDPDNLAMSFKAVVDGLVSCGVLRDDSSDVIGTPDYRWEKAKRGEGHVTIEVWEVVGERATCPACGQAVD